MAEKPQADSPFYQALQDLGVNILWVSEERLDDNHIAVSLERITARELERGERQ